jgi:hypothetical protein
VEAPDIRGENILPAADARLSGNWGQEESARSRIHANEDLIRMFNNTMKGA